MREQEPTMTIAEELMAQRDSILFGTWVQGGPRTIGEACAVVRAIPYAGSEDYSLDLAGVSSDAARYLDQGLLGLGYLSVISWNDAPGRTRQEVLDLLDDGIRRAKELGI